MALVVADPRPDFNPRWDAARGRLVFLREVSGEIEVWATDGRSPATRVVDYPGDEEPLDWAPDGGAFVFSARRNGNRDIFLFDLERGREIRLTSDPAADLQPRWSPDGQQIAFVSSRTGNNDVWLVDRGGRGARNVTRSDANEGHPSWAPAGRRLLYDCDATEDGLPDIFVHDLATGERTNLTRSRGVDLIAEWSPDGGWIAFGSSRTGDWNVFVMRADGADVRQLTAASAFDGDPKWIPSAWVSGR